MRVYLDVCSLNRFLDDQSQDRVRMESEAIRLILSRCSQRSDTWVASEVVEEEVWRTPDESRRTAVLALLKSAQERLTLTPKSMEAARAYHDSGLGVMDALHLAVASSGRCDVLISTDDGFVARAHSISSPPHPPVMNPIRGMNEQES
jgi:predicted nucleic acid-binding protein